MLKAYRYRIYPNKEQEEFFIKTFGACRFVWNKMLEEKLGYLNRKEKIPRITPAKYKKEYPFLKDVDSLALANIQLQNEKAFRDYFKNSKCFKLPKFKKKKNKQSYTTNNVNNSIKIDFENELVFLPKIKSGIKTVFHRTFIGKIKSATITKTKTEKYFVSILVEIEQQSNLQQPQDKICGIDLGLKNFAIITNEKGQITKIDSPKYLHRAEKRLKRQQRQLSKKQKGSKNKERQRVRLAKLHEYIINARNDFLHKLSSTIIRENQTIVVENLNVKGLSQTNLSKNILDNSLRKFLTYLNYKAQWHNRTIIVADRFYQSSKTCSVCGSINHKLTLKDRIWICEKCGTYHDRDINASVNLMLYGIKQVGMEQPEFTPVNYALTAERDLSRSTSYHRMKQEAYTSIGGR